MTWIPVVSSVLLVPLVFTTAPGTENMMGAHRRGLPRHMREDTIANAARPTSPAAAAAATTPQEVVAASVEASTLLSVSPKLESTGGGD